MGGVASATASVLVLWPQADVRAVELFSAQPDAIIATGRSSHRPMRGAERHRRRHAGRSAAAQAAASAKAAAAARCAAFVENPRGAIQGYVAGRSMAGTKTNTPIMQTPQSLSVIGSEQIRDQKPGKFDEILRYTPGVRRRHLRRRHPQRLVPDPRLQVRRYRPVPRRPAAVLHLLCELEAAAVQPCPRRSAARSLGRAVWRLQPERHRQRRQQDAAGRADPLSRDRRQQFRQCLSRRSISAARSRLRPKTASCSTAWSGKFRTAAPRSISRPTTTIFIAPSRHLQAGRRHDLHRAGVSVED